MTINLSMVLEDEFEEAPEPAEELNPRVPPAELRPTAPDAPGPSGIY